MQDTSRRCKWPDYFQGRYNFGREGDSCSPRHSDQHRGVTVSYFEWLKNIEHVSPGKLTKRWQEKTKLRLLTAVGVNIGQTSPYFKNLEGANEMDIVCSGLEDIMIEAVQRNWRYSMAHKVNLRDACYINAMTEIHDSV